MMAARPGSGSAPAESDFSALGHDDLANIVLQRSGIIDELPNPGRVIRAWHRGDHGPLDEVVQQYGTELAKRAAAAILVEFEALRPILDWVRPRLIADIGAGYGFFDLFVHRRYGSKLLLIDVESNERRHFGFAEEAAAYTSLQTARVFLVANGVPADNIATWNPEEQDLETEQKADLAVSFLSCGFHFPVDMYLPFFRFGVAPGGRIILDLRGGRFQQSIELLAKLGDVQVLAKGNRRKQVIVRKGEAK